MELEILIDEITNCIRDRDTNVLYNTESRIVKNIDKNTARIMMMQGWNFDWSIPFEQGMEVCALTIKGQKKTQGLIAYTDMGSYYHIELVESHPDNQGHNGKYKGVGGNLFALVCKKSFDMKYGGYVQFVAKSDLINHYIATLRAELISSQNMIIRTEAATYLVEHYFKEVSDGSC